MTIFNRAFLKQGCVLLVLSTALAGCASSNVERESTSNADLGLHNARNLADNAASSDIPDTYQNASQATKGAILGGTAGGVAGSFMSGVGFIPGALTGALLGGSYGGYIDSQTNLSDQLINRGANVIVLGDQIMIVINSSRLFDGMSDRLKEPSYSTLDVLAAYINSNITMSVKIAAYTDDVGSAQINLITSRKQAQAIEKYLAACGVSTRLLVAEGYGGTNLIAKNQETWGDSDNYRIEITMEKQHV